VRPLWLTETADGCVATPASPCCGVWSVHLVTRKSELERILCVGPFTVEMQKAFTRSLRASRQLAGVKRQVLGEFEFDVTAAASTIASVKKMSTSSGNFRNTCVHLQAWSAGCGFMVPALCLATVSCSVLPNLMRCLEGINRTNAVIRSCVRLSQTPYNSNDAHHERMLEKLWCAVFWDGEILQLIPARVDHLLFVYIRGDLKPGVQRAGGRLTKEWGDIGFQGTDPASDFRYPFTFC
jgi:ELMO/CED-12 family